MKPIRILIPVPSYGFDPTEAAIPWKILSEHQYDIYFATPQGNKATSDLIILTGKGLGIWKSILRARHDAVKAYHAMENSDSFNHPLNYAEIREKDFDALFLPGGHDKGVRDYLESRDLQQLIVDFFRAQKPVGAICHGPLLVARSINPETGKSVLYNYKTTSLLKSQELLAYYITRFWLKDYYLTYPGKTVEDEVKSYLFDSNNFLKGPFPLLRDSKKHLNWGFVVKDRHYLSARWPGDVYHLTDSFMSLIQEFVN